MRGVQIRFFVCAILMWLALSPLSSIELLTEQVGDQFRLLTLIPFQELQFENAQDSDGAPVRICHNELSIDVVDGRGNEKHHELVTIQLQLPAHIPIPNTIYPVQASVRLPKGFYVVHLHLFNKRTGAKKMHKVEVRLSKKGVEAGALWAISVTDGVGFMSRAPLPWSQIDRVMFSQAFATKPDSVTLMIEGKGAWSMQYAEDDWRVTITPDGWSDRFDHARTVAWYGDREVRTRFHSPSTVYLFQLEYTPKEQLAQLRYILNSNEYRSFHKLDEEDLQAALDRYWESNDPSPGTQLNEFRQAFYQRVRIADQRYTIKGGRRGWQTDMGRIFITYGDPDEVVEDLHPNDLPPYQIWRYYDEMKEYVFYDMKGFGNYELKNKWQD